MLSGKYSTSYLFYMKQMEVLQCHHRTSKEPNNKAIVTSKNLQHSCNTIDAAHLPER